jgi:hypothetical protein
MLALGVAGVGTYLMYRADMRAARSRLLAGSRVVSTARGPIEVAVVGAGPPVLVVHGTGGGFDQGMNIARGFMGEWGEGFRRIAISRFGYLRTPCLRTPPLRPRPTPLLLCSTPLRSPVPQ